MVVCIGLTAPSKPQLIIDIACAIHPPVAVGEIDSELCRRDVGVQKVAAKLTMGFTLTSGILSVLSTGWWGSLSDRFGRCKVMAFGQLGILLSDAAFLFVVSHSELITTFGHWILYVGPVLFGIFGGLNTFNVGSGAYLADLAGDGSIAGYLSMVIGFVRIGMIVGPILGTLLMEASGDVLLPLKVAVAVHIVICAVAFTIIPESLSREARERAAKDTATVSTEPTSWSTWLLAPLAPLAIFLPTQSQIQRGRSAFAQGHFNMFILAVVSFIISMTRGVDVLKAQYATLVLGWTQKQFGPFMSFVESCKVAILMIVIPRELLTHCCH
jgi:MFS family permease